MGVVDTPMHTMVVAVFSFFVIKRTQSNSEKVLFFDNFNRILLYC